MSTLKHSFTKTPLYSNRRQKGVGLIEVLVALVVVSIGVLGMASLQLTGMKHSSGGFNRTKALLYANDMATRMRINSGVAQDYVSVTSTNTGCPARPAPYCADRERGSPGTCSIDEMREFDIYTVSCGVWTNRGETMGVIGTLPNGELSINCLDAACNSNSAYEVTVSWTEGRSRTDADELDTRRVQVRLRP